jgi:hypothetical protein
MNIALTIKKSNVEKRLVYGELYPSGVPDSDNDYMTLSELEDTAHRFLMRDDTGCVDIQHNGVLVEANVVQSWIQEEPSEYYRTGAWVIVMYVDDSNVWDAIKANELNGFSMEASGYSRDVEVEIDVPEYVIGETLPEDGHAHKFVAFFSADAKMTGGETDAGPDGHTHILIRGTITEPSSGHAHKYRSVYNFIKL